MNEEFISSPRTRRLHSHYPAKRRSGFRVASRILLVCILYALHAAADRPCTATRRANLAADAGSHRGRDSGSDSSRTESHNFDDEGRHARMAEPSFAHLTTNDSLSQSSVTEILQDRRGFMWFAMRDGLDRYDGSALVVYKHHPNDPPAHCATLFCRAFRG